MSTSKNKKQIGKGKTDFRFKKSAFADEMWPRIAEELGMNPDLDHYRAIWSARAQTASAPVKTTSKPAWRNVALRAAAVVVPVALVVGGYFALEVVNRVSHNDKTVESAFVAHNSITAGPDGIEQITLADGTEVTLNRNSTLSYNDSRQVELTGEAYFEVVKDPQHPFVIHSDHLKVSVLGTEFNFQTQTEDGVSKLSLYEGQVQLKHAAGVSNLEEGGQEFTFDHATARTEIGRFDPTQKPQWFVEALQPPLPEIIHLGKIFDLIETHYDVVVEGRRNTDTGRRLNFVLDDAASIDDVMLALQFVSGDFDYTINGNTITIEKK